MKDIVIQLKQSVDIVRHWRNMQLPNGRSLDEQLTIDGISFWELVEPTLSIYYLPEALSTHSRPFLFGGLRPHITLMKQRMLNLRKQNKHRQQINLLVKEQQPFLFLGFNGYMYRDVLEPVALFLADHMNQDSIVIADELQFKTRYQHSNFIQYHSIWEFYEQQVDCDARNIRKKLSKATAELYQMDIFSLLFREHERKFWPYLKSALNWILNYHLPFLIERSLIGRRIVEIAKPSLIISVDIAADPSKRIYSMLGRQFGIPILEVQLSPVGKENVELLFIAANKIAAWGDMSQKSLLEHGILKEQIEITGSPKHDSLVNNDVKTKEKVRQQLGLPNDSLMVLCASTYQTKEYDKLSEPELLVSMKKAVFQISGKNLFLVVKAHPLENLRETKKLAGENKNIIFIEGNENITDLIKSCDIFLSFGSTATFDALIANKLVICPAFPKWIWSEIFVDSNAVLAPESVEEINRIFIDINRKKISQINEKLYEAKSAFLQKFVFEIDGNATERVANLAVEMKLT